MTSAGPELWIRQGYDLHLAGHAIPPAMDARAGAWMQIGHDLAGRLADAQIEEIGTTDAMPLPDWPALANQTIQEHQHMIDHKNLPIADTLRALAYRLDEISKQHANDEESRADLVAQLNNAKQAAQAYRRDLEEAQRANAEMREELDRLRAGARAQGIEELIRRAETAAETIRRYERSQRDANGRPRTEAERKIGTGETIHSLDFFTAPTEHPDAGQEAEEAIGEYDHYADDLAFDADRENRTFGPSR